jgi:hypothetical protein
LSSAIRVRQDDQDPEPSLHRRISRNKIESFDRHEKLRVFGVDEKHELAAGTARVDRLQRIESTDAVINVHDVVAGFQIAKIGDECTEFVFPSSLARDRGSIGVLHFAENIGFGEYFKTCGWDLESAGELSDSDGFSRDRNIVFAKDLFNTLGKPERFHCEQRHRGLDFRSSANAENRRDTFGRRERISKSWTCWRLGRGKAACSILDFGFWILD